MKRYWIVTIFLLLLICGCSNNRWDIKTDNSYQLEINRFEQDLFSVNPDSVWQYVPMLEQKYGAFFDLFNEQIIRIGGTYQMDYDRRLAGFLTDMDITGMLAEVNRVFGTEKLVFADELSVAWARFNAYFPEIQAPKLQTHLSGLNQNMVVDSGLISISLDKYLGVNNKYYQMLRLPQYQQKNMHPQKIATDVVLALGTSEFEFSPITDNMLSNMLYYGKLHVFIDALLPNADETLKWGYTEQQLEWCRKNEQSMWLSIVDKKALFSTSGREISRMVGEGPFTASFSQKSPGGVGQWIGYQIIMSYLDHNPQVTLQQLMRENDYQKILNESHYRP